MSTLASNVSARPSSPRHTPAALFELLGSDPKAYRRTVLRLAVEDAPAFEAYVAYVVRECNADPDEGPKVTKARVRRHILDMLPLS